MIVHDTVATSMFCLYLFYFNCLCLIYLLLCEGICTWGRLQVFFLYSLSCFPASIGYVAWIKYLLPDPWMLLSLQPEIAREGRSLWLQDDIPQRPVEVQQNLKAKGGSPFSLGCSHALAQMRGFPRPRAICKCIVAPGKRGSECWKEAWIADGDFGWCSPAVQ